MSKKIDDHQVPDMKAPPRKSRGYAGRGPDCAAGVPRLRDLARRSEEADTVETDAFQPTPEDVRRIANGGEP